MKKLILTALLFTNISFGATFSQETQDKLRLPLVKSCVNDMQKKGVKVSLKKIEDYCDCGVKNALALPINEQEDEAALVLAVESCVFLLADN